MCIRDSDKTDRPPREIATLGVAQQRTEHACNNGNNNHAGEDSIHELDHGMEFERRYNAVFGTGRPVGATKAGAGQTNGTPGDDDHDQRDQGYQRDSGIGLG